MRAAASGRGDRLCGGGDLRRTKFPEILVLVICQLGLAPLWFSPPTRPRAEGIQYGNSCSLKIRDVAGHNSEAIFKGSCGDRQIETFIANLV
jgi:hypothetical protein